MKSSSWASDSGSSPTKSQPRRLRVPVEMGALGVLLLLLLALLFLAPAFFQTQPLLSLLTREAPAWIITMGMALVMITRQIDISVGSQFAVCGVIGGLLSSSGCPVLLVLPICMICGAISGALNGWLVAVIRLPSIVVTLATMMIWREGLRWMRQGEFVNLPDGTQWFGLSQQVGQWGLLGVAIAIGFVLNAVLRRRAGGRFLYAVGSDPEAARLAGIPAERVTLLVFVAMGALAGMAAWLNLVQSPQVDPKSGTGLELKAIAACVVGGIAVAGGRGRLVGVAIGFLLLICISPALTHLHVQAYWEKAIQGGIILTAVLMDRGGQRR